MGRRVVMAVAIVGLGALGAIGAMTGVSGAAPHLPALPSERFADARSTAGVPEGSAVPMAPSLGSGRTASAIPMVPTSTPVTTALTTSIAAPTSLLPVDGPSVSQVSSTDRENELRRVQQRLTELGYWLGAVDGKSGASTTQAVYAFQKVNGLPRTGQVDETTNAALAVAERPAPRSAVGDVTEIDKARQVIVIVRNGRTVWVLNTSTGTEKAYRENGRSGIADTPVGTFTVDRQVNANDPGPLGSLYRPKYFQRDGIAVHGAVSVPPYPASHGCARVSNAAMDFIWQSDLMPLHSRVFVY